MTSFGRYVLAAICLGMLAGCSFSTARQGTETSAPDAPKFGPMAPNPFGDEITLSQTITGIFGKEEHSLRFEVELRPDRLVMLALTHVGVPVFSIEYDGKEARIQRLVPGVDQIDPYWILNDFLLVYWPQAELSKALMSAGYSLQVGEKKRFMIDAEGHTAVSVSYLTPPTLGGDVDLDNRQFHYSLKVRTHMISRGAVK